MISPTFASESFQNASDSPPSIPFLEADAEGLLTLLSQPWNPGSGQALANLLETIERPAGSMQRRLLSQNTPASELPNPEIDIRPVPPQTPVLPETIPEVSPSLPSNSAQVEISEIQVIGSSVFDDGDFDLIVSAYEGRSLGLRDLRQVANEITQLYLQFGYITSRAVLSEQTIVDGIVQIRVVEGELENIQVEGTRRLARYVRDRVNLANRKPLSQVALESQLQLLRADPLIERIEASLRAGTGEGQSSLIVRVSEAPAFSGRAVLDTNSPPSVGIARMGIEASYNNALGLGDQLAISAFRTTTGGANTYGITYGIPLNAMDGTLQARYLPSNFELVEPVLAALGVRGASRTYELTYRQPIIRQPNQEFALSLGFRHRAGETLVSNVVIDSTRTSVFQFGQDYLKRDRTGAWGVRSQFNLGTGLLDATDSANGDADGQFFSWLGQMQRAQVISRDNLLLIQGSVQLSADSLLGADQFIVGGPTSVRGYDQNARFGDNGFRASVEDRITLLKNDDGSPAIQIAPFLDTAAVWNRRADINEQRFLLGTGVGLLTNVVENLQARLDFGIPLIKLNESGDSNQDIFLYFNLDYRF
ncbi:MAG: ShlB/FhaC/HecB family hemolysin secretion/activation protein [Phormidesmis sp.]